MPMSDDERQVLKDRLKNLLDQYAPDAKNREYIASHLSMGLVDLYAPIEIAPGSSRPPEVHVQFKVVLHYEGTSTYIVSAANEDHAMIIARKRYNDGDAGDVSGGGDYEEIVGGTAARWRA